MENESQNAYLPGSDTDALEPFDVRQQSGKRGMVILTIIAGCAALALIIFMTLFSDGTRGREDAPRILADNEPYKAVPDDPGGEQTPNQTIEVYGLGTKTNGDEPSTAMPGPEQPMDKPEAVPTKPAANVVIKETATTKPAASSTPTATKPISAPAPAPRPAAVSGDYVVQVAAVRSQAQAESLWDGLTTKMSGIIGPSHFADIKRVNLEDKGIYYRLRVSGLKDKAAAARLCTRLKAEGQDCIVKKK